MTIRSISNKIKSGSTNRSLLAAMVVTYIKEAVLLQDNKASAGTVAKTLLGADHADRARIVKAINANIAYYRKRFISVENPKAVDSDFVHVGRAGVYGAAAWETLYNECDTLGRAGFFLRAWIQHRIPDAPAGSLIVVADLIKATDKIVPERLVSVLQHLFQSDMTSKDRHVSWLVEQLLQAGKEDLEVYARWLCAENVAVGPVDNLSLDAWLDEEGRSGVRLGEEIITPEPEPEPELADEVVPARKHRSPRKWVKWSLAAMSLSVMCFVAVPFTMENTRSMISSKGLGATYQYVLHRLSDGQLAGKDLRDSALILSSRGEVGKAVAILEQVAFSKSYSDKLRADCFVQLGRIAMELDLNAAIDHISTAYELYPKASQRNWPAMDLSLVYMYSGDVSNMEYWLNHGIELREESGFGNLIRERQLKIRLAVMTQRYPKALELAKEAYGAYRDSNDRLSQGMFARELAIAYALMGDTTSARDYTNEAMHLFGSMEYVDGLNHLMVNYLLIHKMEGRSPTDYQQQVLEDLASQPRNFEIRADLDLISQIAPD